MRTKSFLFSMLAVAGMLFVSSCAQDEPLEGAADANYVDATFTLTTEDAAGTRATVGNGRKADKVVCGVFDKYGVEMDLRQTIDVEGKTATYKTRLAKGQDYRVVFFAYNKAAAAYDVTDLKDIKVVGSQKSNIEERDAFTAYIDIKADETLNSVTKRVELRRPFAQLNLGINQAEYDAAKAAGIVVANTEIKVSNVYSNFSAYDNAVAAGAQEGELTFTMNAIPAEKLEVDVNRNGVIDDTEKFHYLALNYLLVGNVDTEKKLTDVEFRWENEDGSKTNSPVTEFINIPVQRNYRTNIIGSLLTSPATFNIVIDSTFNGEYNNDDMLDKALAEGGEFKLFADMTIDESMTIEAGKEVVIDLGGNTLTVASENIVKGNLTIENGDVVIDIDGSSEVNVAFAAYNGATVNLSNANVEVADKNAAVVFADGNVEATVNVSKTTMTVGNGSHGISMPFGAKSAIINVEESTITGGDYALYLYATNSVVTIDEKSLIENFWVMGGNVDVVYTGKKPVIKQDGLAATINYYNKGEYALKEELENGGEVTLTSDVTLTQALVIPAGTEVTLNLNGRDLNVTAAYNDNNATASSVIVNNGKLTLKGDGVIRAENNYSVRNYGTMNIDGVTIENGVMNFGDLTVESGNISNSRSGKHGIYGNNAKLTVNGGTFHNDNPGNATIFAYAGEVVINGGEFTIADGSSTLGWTSCLLDAQGGAYFTLKGGIVMGEIRDYNKHTTVYGGTYSHNSVKNFLASGYKAVENNGLYYVVADGVEFLTPQNYSSTTIASNTKYHLIGDFTNSNVSLVMAQGVENVVFDGEDAKNINELIVTQNGALINNANTPIGQRSGNVTVQNFNILSQINVFACKTEVVVQKNTAEALMIYAGNCDVKVLNNTIDANFESHPTYRNENATWNTNNYGIALNIFDYNLWLDGNTVTDATGHSIGINGWEGTIDNGDENKIESFKNNTITVNSTTNTKRAAFKVWDDETYASNDDDTNVVNATAQSFIDSVLADGSNTFNIIDGYNHTIFSFYNVNTNN